MKRVYKLSLNVDRQMTMDEIDSVTSSILTLIMDYDFYCEEQEKLEEKQRMIAPRLVMNDMTKKIQSKMCELKEQDLVQINPPDFQNYFGKGDKSETEVRKKVTPKKVRNTSKNETK